MKELSPESRRKTGQGPQCHKEVTSVADRAAPQTSGHPCQVLRCTHLFLFRGEMTQLRDTNLSKVTQLTGWHRQDSNSALCALGSHIPRPTQLSRVEHC